MKWPVFIEPHYSLQDNTARILQSLLLILVIGAQLLRLLRVKIPRAAVQILLHKRIMESTVRCLSIVSEDAPALADDTETDTLASLNSWVAAMQGLANYHWCSSDSVNGGFWRKLTDSTLHLNGAIWSNSAGCP